MLWILNWTTDKKKREKIETKWQWKWKTKKLQWEPKQQTHCTIDFGDEVHAFDINNSSCCHCQPLRIFDMFVCGIKYRRLIYFNVHCSICWVCVCYLLSSNPCWVYSSVWIWLHRQLLHCYLVFSLFLCHIIRFGQAIITTIKLKCFNV